MDDVVYVGGGTQAWEAAGLPLVISNRAGSYPDLQKQSAFVRTFTYRDVTGLSMAMEEAMGDAIQGRVQQIVSLSDWTYKALAENLCAFLERKVGHA